MEYTLSSNLKDMPRVLSPEQIFLMSVHGKELFISISCPLLCCVPGVNIILPFHSDFQASIVFVVTYVSCKHEMS